MFPSKNSSNAFLEWDEEKQYSVENIEVWIQEFMVLPLPSDGPIDVDALRHHFKEQVEARWVCDVAMDPCEPELYVRGSSSLQEVCDPGDPGLLRLCKECVPPRLFLSS